MVSSFQFSNPSLLKLSFALNNGFETKDASQINISLESHVETQPGCSLPQTCFDIEFYFTEYRRKNEKAERPR